MSAFTPGPWRALKNGIITSDDCQIGRVGSYDDNELLPFSKDRWDADAKLIAAAPDLEEALQLLLTEMELSGNAGSKDYGWPKAVAASRAALAKAGVA